MKNMIKIQTILLVAFFLSIPFALLSQEDTKEKTITVKIVKEVDGKKIVKDTTFTVSSDQDVKTIVRQFTMDAEGDSTAGVMVDVMVDIDEDHDVAVNKKIIVISKGGEDTDWDFDTEKKVIIIKDGNLEKHVIEYEFDMKNLQKEMSELNNEMREMQIMIIDEEGKMHDKIIELEYLEELKGLEELEKIHNMEVFMMPGSHFPHGNKFVWKHRRSMDVPDIELREAGIKNKPDRLDLDEIDINNEDGIIDLSFTLKEEGAPKVAVYNVYGDKVFSGKPELMNNKYQVKMDLSKKQHGNYYLMIVLGNSSKTMRLKL